MISEQELARLSYPEAPKIVTDKLPGPKTQKMFDEARKYQTPTRPSVKVALAWDEGRGATVKDPDGNIFLDLSGGVAVCGVGRNHPKVVEAVQRQSQKIMHTSGLLNSNTIALAKKLASTMPGNMRDNSFTAFGMSGSGAVDIAIKYARAITRKSQIVAFEGAYHGVFYGSLAISPRDTFRAGFGPFMPGVVHMPYAYCYRCFAGLKYPECGIACGKYFDYKLNTPNTGADDVAAVFVEPIQGEGGYIDPPPEFLKMVREACDKKGALLIADEIQAGAGRTGKMWSIEHYGVVPDMIIWAKSIGGDQPVSGITIRAELWDKLPVAAQPLTFAENALSMAVALANVEILTDPETDLIGRAAIVGQEAKDMIMAATKDSKVIGDVRGKGLMIGLELVKNKETREPASADAVGRVAKKLQERGVRVMPSGRHRTTVRLMPPLVITREHLNKGVDMVLAAIKENEADLMK